MTSSSKALRKTIFLGAILASVLAITASAQTLSSDLTAKAKGFKDADSTYTRALCKGSESERNEALGARARSESELEKMIADTAAQAPEVQKALDAAADAGETADKIAASPGASDHDKSDAKDKFQKAKADLHDALAKAKGGIEAQISKDFGVKYEPLEACPDQPKAAEHRSNAAKSARRRNDNAARASEQSAPAAPPLGIGIGGGGIGLGIGGLGISIGR